MQETGSEAEAGRDPLPVAQMQARDFQKLLVLRIALDIGQQRHIVARLHAVEMGAQVMGDGVAASELGDVHIVGVERDAVFAEERRLTRQGARFLEGGGQLARLDLAGLDVGLIERIDVQHRPRDGDRHLQEIEHLAQLIRLGDRDAHDRMPGRLERRQRRRLGGLAVAQVEEDAVLAVVLGRRHRLAVDRDQAFAPLAGRFRDELFGPGADARIGGCCKDRHLVAAVVERQAAQGDAKPCARIHRRGHARRAAVDHALGRGQQVLDIQAHGGGRHQPELGQDRIAPADRRPAEKRAGEFVGRRGLLHGRARVGHGDEVPAGLIGADRLGHAMVEVVLEDIGLERRAGLGRDDEQAAGEVDRPLDRPHLVGVGRIQHMEFGPAGLAAEGFLQHGGAQARAAHAEQHDMAPSLVPHALGKRLQRGEVGKLDRHDLEPAEPFVLVRPGP